MKGAERKICPSMCLQKRKRKSLTFLGQPISKSRILDCHNQPTKSTSEETMKEDDEKLASNIKEDEKPCSLEDLVKRTEISKDGKIVLLKMKPVILNFYTCYLCSHWRSTSAKLFEKHNDQNHKSIEEKTENLALNSDIKPHFSYAQLIIQAILHAPEMQITLLGIYYFIHTNYPYYKMSNSDWKNAIRHNLSVNRYFVKVSKHPNECWPGKKRRFRWTIDPAYEGFNRTTSDPNEEKCDKN